MLLSELQYNHKSRQEVQGLMYYLETDYIDSEIDETKLKEANISNPCIFEQGGLKGGRKYYCITNK